MAITNHERVGLDEAVRRFLAWESVLAEKENLNLDPQQVKSAESCCRGYRRFPRRSQVEVVTPARF